MLDPKSEKILAVSDIIFALADKLGRPSNGTMAILVALCEFITENIAQKDIDEATKLAQTQMKELIGLKVKHMEEEKKLWN